MENSLFIVGKSPKGSVAALPDKAGGRVLSERIITAIATANESLEQATARLIRLAEVAYGQRRNDELDAIADALLSVPFAAAHRAGNHYKAIALKRGGELDRAADLLADLDAPRALHALASIRIYQRNTSEAVRLHTEAMRAARR